MYLEKSSLVSYTTKKAKKRYGKISPQTIRTASDVRQNMTIKSSTQSATILILKFENVVAQPYETEIPQNCE